jgi:two-component system, sensor histidine kinase and response regulator
MITELSHTVAEPTMSSQTRPKPTLLIVDDEEGPRQALRVIFAGDYNVLLAEDGYAAIELAQTRAIDVAVLDIRMAGMSGIDVLERIRFVDPTIGVVMMTAYETTETLRQAMRLSASDSISKPFDIATMRAAVNRALARRTGGIEARSSVEKVEELKTELHRQKMDEEVLRSRNDIYASVLHDMNGPLTIISGLTQLINQRIAGKEAIVGEDLEATRDHLQRITRQVTNCAEISRRYLSFLRQNPNENLRVSVNEILGDVSELLRFHPAVKNHDLSIQRMAHDATAGISGTDLIQILLNLTVNALQCSPERHRVEVGAEQLDEPLDVQAFENGPTDRYINLDGFNNVAPIVALKIEDNGPGMAPEILAQLFEAYFTTKPKGQGTGLGLCIVQRLVKESQGAIHVHSVAGKGTTFTVYLPARMNGQH